MNFLLIDQFLNQLQLPWPARVGFSLPSSLISDWRDWNIPKNKWVRPPSDVRHSSHPEPPCLETAWPGRKAEPYGPEYLTVKSIFLQLTFSSWEECHIDDLSSVMWPRRLNEWNLCGVMAAVMRDSEYCVWEHWTVLVVVRRNVSEVMMFLWSLVSSPLQVLYFTYLYSSARRSIGLDEKIRREVYDRLMPAFEELFDKVEEHTLNILLEPWTLLVSRDKQSFQKVSQFFPQFTGQLAQRPTDQRLSSKWIWICFDKHLAC